QAVHASAVQVLEQTVKEVRREAAVVVKQIRDRLEDLGLLVTAEQGWLARLVPLFLVLGVVLLGVIKILVGLSRNRPVGVLVAVCVATAIVTLLGFARAVHRTRLGDRVLHQIESENGVLWHTAQFRPETLRGADLTLAVALFGTAILAGGPLSHLSRALRPP